MNSPTKIRTYKITIKQDGQIKVFTQEAIDLNTAENSVQRYVGGHCTFLGGKDITND